MEGYERDVASIKCIGLVRVKALSEERVSDTAYVGRPSVCRNCGALVGAGESNCGQCGAPVPGAVIAARRPLRDAEALRFARAIISRPATFTFIFLTANIFVFLLMQLSGGSENPATLMAFGAKFNSLINAGEWWRFVTPVFIHIGVVHLLVNMYGLFMLGPYVEKLYGSAKFVVFWILTGIAGVVASYLAVRPDMQGSPLGRFFFKTLDGPAAGASGALFGLVGVLFVFGIKFRHELPDGFKRAFGTGLLPTIAINLFIGYIGRGFIDNAAHMGGLVAGAVLALFVSYKRPGERGGIAIFWHVLQIAALALVIISFVMVGRNYRGAPPTFDNVAERLLTGNTADIEAYIKAFNEGRQAFVLALKGDAGAANKALEGLNQAPHLDDKSDVLRDELKSLITQARDFGALKPKEQAAPRRRAQLKKLIADFEAWQERSNQWVQNEGGKFGIKLVEKEP